MATSGSVFSQTLQDITNAKLEELSKKRNSFEQQKAATIADSRDHDDPIDMLTAVTDGVMRCFSITTDQHGKIVRGSSKNAKLETDLRNLRRFLDQARFDPSISPSIMRKWKQTLISHLDVQSLKYQYADLYGKLTVEWLMSSTSEDKKTSLDEAEASERYEEIPVRAKFEAKQNWEKSVFEEAKVDQSAIGNLLETVFGSKEAQKALQQLRSSVRSIESSMSAAQNFNTHTLRRTIKGLLTSDLLNNEKKQVLRDFSSNEVILAEVADVLNMRMTALESWSWGPEVAVEARRQLNGSYNIYMHEDVLQAILLQYLGIEWSVGIKDALMAFQDNKEVWHDSSREVTPLDEQQREWYLSSTHGGKTVQQIRQLSYRAGYFVSQLPDNVTQDREVEEGDEEADFVSFERQRKKKIVRRSAPMGSVAAFQAPAVQLARKSTRTSQIESFEEAREEEDDEDTGYGLFGDNAPIDLGPYKPKNPMDAKQRLLHLLSTEILLKTHLDGEITCFRSQYHSWHSRMPHATINAVLAFFGVSKKWLDFFKTFLQAPLKFLGEDEVPRPRRRGTPGAHVLSEFFGELILFSLDYLVNQQTGGELLWRMHDDFWFWSSSHDTCVRAWNIIQEFNKVMGINIDESKSAAVRIQRKNGSIQPGPLDSILPKGEIRWGMLYLDDKTGKFTIDEEMVDEHIDELRRQLADKEKSIFSWVQAYSTYASVFFTSNFGKPANCFGRGHLDSMLDMHQRIQRTLFKNSGSQDVHSVIDWLKRQIEHRFDVKDIPDGYFFFPGSLGGLEVKSPFVGLLQLRDSITKDPSALMQVFREAERDEYENAKKRYLDRRPWQYSTFGQEYRPDNPQQFMSFDDFAKFREELNYGYTNQLVEIYETLLRRPQEEPVEHVNSTDIQEALNRIQSRSGQSQSLTTWYNMDPYWKWITMLYGPEILQVFKTFTIVDAGLLPMGMLSLLRAGSISWQE